MARSAPLPNRQRKERRHAWATLPDAKLLKLKLKDLDVTVEGTWLEEPLAALYEELEARELTVRPHVWLSEEWFSPDDTPGISIPFYLAHPRLIRLERRMILDVEGEGRQECLRILRHETGHVVQHAFSLHRRRRWQELFGRSSTRYPDSYRPNPASKNYVQYLKRWYAQSHPDEDFAETFAVWLSPRSNWRRRYADWPALAKLEYVDTLMDEIAGEKPMLTRRIKVDPISRLNTTLGEHYRRKLEHYAVDTETSFDRDLLRLFSNDARHRRAPTAAAFIRKHRATIRGIVARWTSEHPLTIDVFLDDIADRCRALKLRAPGRFGDTCVNLAVLLTSKTVHSLYGTQRRQWYAL